MTFAIPVPLFGGNRGDRESGVMLVEYRAAVQRTPFLSRSPIKSNFRHLGAAVKCFSPTCVLCCRAGASDKLLPVPAVVGYVSGEAESSPARLVSVCLDRASGVLNSWIHLQALATLPELVILT